LRGPAARARKIRENAALASAAARLLGLVGKGLVFLDFSYLENYVGGEASIVLEVLAVFLEQAPKWDAGLDPANPDWRAVAHTVKGAARGIGAGVLGDLCHTAEFGAPEDLPPVREALAAVVADIAAYQTAKG
jgi:HPt (histidine-containing phosphotransfer) domain-containing protein